MAAVIVKDDVESAVSALRSGSAGSLSAQRNGSAGSPTGHASNPLVRTARQSTLQSVSQSVQSRVSRVASLTERLTARWINRQTCGEPRLSLSEADIAARNEFFAVILYQDGVTLSPADLSEPHVVWYGKFLECRFRGAWTVVTREALSKLPPTYNEPREGDIGIVYNFMTLVAKMLLEKGGKEGCAMSNIVDKAGNKKLLKEQKDGKRDIPTQLAFQAVGWLTMLYDPEPVQRPDLLCIRKAMGTIPRQRVRTRPGRVFTNYAQDLENSEQPLYILFRKFGRFVPKIGEFPNKHELITVSYVCYSILDKVAGVEIEWVNALSQHLEFDNVRRRLKIFRFPSFCMLMYRDLTSISNIYLDHEKLSSGSMRAEQAEDMTPEYFREILLSYRLIFGQDKDSSRTFNSKIPTFPDHWDCSDKQSDDADPMLRILCSSSYNSAVAKQIYDHIDALDAVAPCYYPDSDFPFLGRRLLELQAFVSGRNPHNWKGLWNDRRNVGLWWTFWAVLIIGGSTIILQFVQTIFQVWGSVSAYYQLGSTNSCPTSSQ